MDPNLLSLLLLFFVVVVVVVVFFQKCKQQYQDKLNEVKTPWVLVGAGSSKHIKGS